MQLLVFLLAYPILWIISMLPFRLFYFFSDFIFFIIYYIIGYRKQVVHDNLKLVFPGKTEEELLELQKEYYKHMCDTFLEMIKTLNMSKEELKKRYHICN